MINCNCHRYLNLPWDFCFGYWQKLHAFWGSGSHLHVAINLYIFLWQLSCFCLLSTSFLDMMWKFCCMSSSILVWRLTFIWHYDMNNLWIQFIPNIPKRCDRIRLISIPLNVYVHHKFWKPCYRTRTSCWHLCTPSNQILLDVFWLFFTFFCFVVPNQYR